MVVPVPREPKPRVLQDGRDMFWSMAPLVLACIELAGLVGMCSFQPAGPKSSNVPRYDAAVALGDDARTLGFPIRLPAVPDDWTSNSGRRDGIDDGRTDPATGKRTRALVSTVGYLTPNVKYLSVTQSNADEDRLVASIADDAVPVATGTEQVDGVRWVVYTPEGEDPGEPIWTTHLPSPGTPGTQVAITGAGTVEDFRTLARATQSPAPLPTTR